MFILNILSAQILYINFPRVISMGKILTQGNLNHMEKPTGFFSFFISRFSWGFKFLRVDVFMQKYIREIMFVMFRVQYHLWDRNFIELFPLTFKSLFRI